MLLLTPIGVQAQSWGFDVASMEAFIDDHKEIRSEMWVRAVVEEGNALLLTWENDTIKGYKTINDVLDKYDHYFEMLDFIIKGACTVIKVKKTGRWLPPVLRRWVPFFPISMTSVSHRAGWRVPTS